MRLGIVVKRPRKAAVFFLRFPSAAAAEEVRAVLEEDGFEVEVEQEPAHWLVHAHGRIRPDSFDVAERSLESLAAVWGGRYAGCRLGDFRKSAKHKT